MNVTATDFRTTISNLVPILFALHYITQAYYMSALLKSANNCEVDLLKQKDILHSSQKLITI